jgi:hypothetical protein
MFTLRCRQADLVAGISEIDTSDKLSPVFLLQAINYCRCCCYQRLTIAGVIVTGDKFTVEYWNRWKSGTRLNHQCQWHQPLLLPLSLTTVTAYRRQWHWHQQWHKVVNISPNFCKKFEMAPMIYSGAGGKLILEKTWSWKSCVRFPLKG